MIITLDLSNIDILDNTFLEKKKVKHEMLFNPYAKYLLYIEENDVLGYLYYSDIYERTEINMVEVREDKRNKKIASKLFDEFFKINPKSSTLEVKKNNYNAIKLYEKYGYKKVAIRKGYYNGIDGILMEKIIKIG